MILLHVIANQEKQAIEVADFLMEQKLILDAVILEKVTVRERLKKGVFETFQNTMVMGKTKALLFPQIDRKLRKKYPENMPLLYSVPIVDMNWEQANKLISETAKV
ncbi:MAG: hypothetical protein MI975_14930 [Cytophagales bacterium]|nr:hypothetical protein [Cytophagales bacterium]